MSHGIYAIFVNGVIHSSNFSGIVCATRNPDFDQLTRGWCLAARPLDKEIQRVKVQFGVLEKVGDGNNNSSDDVEMEIMQMENRRGSNTNDNVEVEEGTRLNFVNHAAFGLEGTVRRLRKGEKLM